MNPFKPRPIQETPHSESHNKAQSALPIASQLPAMIPLTKQKLTLELSSAACKKLQAAAHNSYWTADTLVEQLVRDHLHSVYPLITYRGIELAPAGTFRAFDRTGFKPALGMLTSVGKYRIAVREENEQYQDLKKKYMDRGEPNPDVEAFEMCLFELQRYLEDSPDDKKIIYPEDFLVEQIIERS